MHAHAIERLHPRTLYGVILWVAALNPTASRPDQDGQSSLRRGKPGGGQSQSAE
jgi:hypothetical protein